MDAFRALVMDLGFAARTLRKNVAFTAAALATLTVGIGITAAVFTVVNGVLLRPLPYRDPSRIEMIFLSSSRAGYGNEIPLSIGFFADLQANQKSFSGVAAFQPWTPSLSDGAKTELVSAARVTTSLFGVLGIRPAFGRTFNDADGEPGAADVALVSHALWQRRFGGDPSVVGRRIDLGSKSFTIIGIMPPGFAFPRGAELPALTQFSARTDVWAPLAFTKADRGEYRVLSTLAIGRLAPDVTVQHARADLAGVIEASLKAHPRRTPLAYDLIDMQAQAGRHISNTLLFLMGSVVLVLLIACANVTNLLVARTATRRREFAVRAALGAGRARIARQLVAENLLLGAVGTGLGIVVSMAATRAMLSLVPGSLPRADDVTVDWRVVALAGVIAIFVGSVLGLVSALHVRPRNLSATLRDAGARSTVAGQRDGPQPSRDGRNLALRHADHRRGAAHVELHSTAARRARVRSAQRSDRARCRAHSSRRGSRRQTFRRSNVLAAVCAARRSFVAYAGRGVSGGEHHGPADVQRIAERRAHSRRADSRCGHGAAVGVRDHRRRLLSHARASSSSPDARSMAATRRRAFPSSSSIVSSSARTSAVRR